MELPKQDEPDDPMGDMPSIGGGMPPMGGDQFGGMGASPMGGSPMGGGPMGGMGSDPMGGDPTGGMGGGSNGPDDQMGELEDDPIEKLQQQTGTLCSTIREVLEGMPIKQAGSHAMYSLGMIEQACKPYLSAKQIKKAINKLKNQEEEFTGPEGEGDDAMDGGMDDAMGGDDSGMDDGGMNNPAGGMGNNFGM